MKYAFVCITASNGWGIKGIRIDVLAREIEGTRLASTITNLKGRFVFRNLKAGSYLVVNSTRGSERN
jgi:hypothetical protein